MEIVKAKIENIKETGDLYVSVDRYLETHINYPLWHEESYPNHQSAKAAIEKDEMFILKENERIIGAFVMNEDPQGAYEKASWTINLEIGEYLCIHALAIDVACHRRGLAEKMVDYIKSYAKKNGYKSIRLDIVPGNTPARALYEKCGFKEIGILDLERKIEEIPLFVVFEYNL